MKDIAITKRPDGFHASIKYTRGNVIMLDSYDTVGKAFAEATNMRLRLKQAGMI